MQAFNQLGHSMPIQPMVLPFRHGFQRNFYSSKFVITHDDMQNFSLVSQIKLKI